MKILVTCCMRHLP